MASVVPAIRDPLLDRDRISYAASMAIARWMVPLFACACTTSKTASDHGFMAAESASNGSTAVPGTSDGGGEEDDGELDGAETLTLLDAAGAGDGGGGPCNTILVGTLRDFHSDHPDFERDVVGEDPGIVEPTLGADGRPVYAGGTTGTTTGAAAFDEWFRDTDGVNVALPIAFSLEEEAAGQFVFL